MNSLTQTPETSINSWSDTSPFAVFPSERHALLSLALLRGDQQDEDKTSWELIFRYVGNYSSHGSEHSLKLVSGLWRYVEEGATLENLKDFERFTFAFFKVFPEENTNKVTLTLFAICYLLYFRRNPLWMQIGKVAVAKPISQMLHKLRNKHEAGEIDTPFSAYIASLAGYMATGFAKQHNSFTEYCVHKSLRDCLKKFLVDQLSKMSY